MHFSSAETTWKKTNKQIQEDGRNTTKQAVKGIH
jgi:hypothetical protein